MTDKLIELAKAATPGPWRHYRGKLRPQFPTIINEVQSDRLPAIVQWQGFDDSNRSEKQHRANAAFIAACSPEAILSLIAQKETARNEALEDVRKILVALLNNIEADDPYRKKEPQHCCELDNMDGLLKGIIDNVDFLKTPATVLSKGESVMSDTNVIDFETWLSQLKAICKSQGVEHYIEQTGEQCWREMYDEGYTPEDAWGDEVAAAHQLG